MEIHSLSRVLRDQPLIRGMADAHVRFLAGCARSVRFEAGAEVFREGTEARWLYLVQTGRIGLEIQVPGRGATVVESLVAGDTIGWSVLCTPPRWEVDAVALEPTVLLALDGECLRAKLDADHGFGYAFTRRLLDEVHRRLERARLTQLDLYGATQ